MKLTEEAKRRICDRLPAARNAWPRVELEAAAFVRGVGERIESIEDLDRLHTDDVYLALACASGDPTALATFEQTFTPTITAASKGASPSTRDEFEQLLRDKLFVSECAKITDYSGKGSLAGWVKVTARRTFLDLARGIDRKREVPIDDGALIERGAGQDPELAFLKSHYRQEFGDAFGDAMASLSTRDRNLLRQHLVHRLSVDEIGGLYDVHRATAARWVAQARKRVVDETRERMRARLQIGVGELESIMRLIESRIDLSLTRHLRNPR